MHAHAVTLRAIQDGVTLRGFLIQGHTVLQNSMIGSFADPSANVPNSRLSSCTPPSVGVTHNQPQNRQARMDFNGPFTFEWTAPAEGTGPIWLCYTVVQTFAVWWGNDATIAVQEGDSYIVQQ